MKRKLSRAIAAVLTAIVAITVTSCENNGDIGDLYATWNLERVTIDGVDDQDYNGDVSWSFQSNLLWMIAVLDHEQTESCYASWELQDDGKVMTLDLSRGYLSALASLPWGSTVSLEVVTHTSDTLTLKYVNNSNQTLVYYLKKLV